MKSVTLPKAKEIELREDHVVGNMEFSVFLAFDEFPEFGAQIS